MNIRQLMYITAVARNGLNVSAAAESLHTSQPGVSKQIRQLEDELGVRIFERSGRQLTRVTPAGRTIVDLAERALVEIRTLRQAAREASDPDAGRLSIAASQTQARYALPGVIGPFARRYPEVAIELHQGTPEQIADLIARGRVDFAIATEALEHFEDLVLVPCYRWHRAVVVPRGHPLAGVHPLTLEAVAEHPIATYVFGFTGRSVLDAAFSRAGIAPRVGFAATEADVIKTYVRLGLGVGIIARMARDPDTDSDLEFVDAAHLFEPSTVKIALRRGTFLRRYMYDFLEAFAAHLTRERLDAVLTARDATQAEAVFAGLALPVR